MRMRKFLFLLPILLLPGVTACESALPQPEPPHLILEGWIDSGGHPMVHLSESMPLREGKLSQEEMLQSIAKWAKVTVSDGETTEILTGQLDTDYFPPYVFTSSRITGVPGRTYSLRVEYKDYLATAETTIPEPLELDAVYPRAMGDSLYSVVCRFTDPPAPGNCYKVFACREGKDTQYLPATMTHASDEVFSGTAELVVFHLQGLLHFLYFPNISLGDTVWIKFCTMDRVQFDFWKNYELLLGSNANAIYSFESSLESNVRGAIGNWAGYGATEYKVEITGASARTGK